MFCDWPVDYASIGPCDTLNDLSEEQRTLFEEMAAEYLWRWTGKRFGLCEATLRPCRRDCTAGLSTFGRLPGSVSPWEPALIGGRWFNVGCGGAACGDTCGCVAGQTLRFARPVWQVLSVDVDGTTLPSGSWRLDEGVRLTRLDGGTWPYCQDMSKPIGEADTWAITLLAGAPVPAGGRIAAGKLACEFAKAVMGSKDCELPQRWQTITRQGVTISAAIDLFEGLDEGKTGIWIVDSWVASVNKPAPGFALASPDYRPPGRRMT